MSARGSCAVRGGTSSERATDLGGTLYNRSQARSGEPE